MTADDHSDESADERNDENANVSPSDGGVSPEPGREQSGPAHETAGSPSERTVLPLQVALSSIKSEIVGLPRLPAPASWAVRPFAVEEPASFDRGPISILSLRHRATRSLSPFSVVPTTIKSSPVSLPPRSILGGADIPTDTQNEAHLTQEPDSSANTEERAGDSTANRLDADTLPTFEELLFEIRGGSLGAYDPLCIVAVKTVDEDDYTQTLETLCCEQFRQLRGGKPSGRRLAASEAEILEETRVENRIISYDDDIDDEYLGVVAQLGDDDLEPMQGDIDLEKLHNRIDEFFTQTLGYLLLSVSDPQATTLYDHLRSTDAIRESTRILSVRPRPLPTDVTRELVQLAWGDIDLTIDSSPPSLDRLFQHGEAIFNDALVPADEIVELTARDVHGEGESRLHYWVKCLVVEQLLKEDDLFADDDILSNRLAIKERIATEYPLSGGTGPIPDVYQAHTNEVFEVETLYGTDHKKITETIDKYNDTNVQRVNIVIPNLTGLRNLPAILRKAQHRPGGMFSHDVRFWTLDVANRRLVPFTDVAERVSEICRRSGLLQ